MSLLTSPTPFGTAAVRRRSVPAGAILPPAGRRGALHVALARRGGVSSRTQRRLEERGGKKRGGGSVTAPAPPGVDEAIGEEPAEWEGEPLGFEVSTEPMPELQDPDKPDFWEGPQWEPLGFFVQYMWAFGVVFGLVACGVAVATYNDGATDFRDTPAYKESLQSQEFPEESESSGADVFEGNPTEVAPALE
ncbi:hypothetical protein PR202_gb11220 [Eleusine coracana subsp. coracana]|uniref:Uncharacterized protein n=1 Tax=Eleusine coracana subsp. coracana TaxID=191504 RepID=A0AAV5EMT9_ELECO|nr:hypothetical protein QOZ80_3BG0264510 [Eleusine coracana subsp. coracana]GJN23560.1 hypothetical protein PR202_gb11220 [Eleusine coracana subsp. coracana]